MVKGMFVWAAGEGSRGMGGPLMRTPPYRSGGRSRDHRQVRQPVAVQERPRTRQPVRATPHGVALQQHHLPPARGGHGLQLWPLTTAYPR